MTELINVMPIFLRKIYFFWKIDNKENFYVFPTSSYCIYYLILTALFTLLTRKKLSANIQFISVCFFRYPSSDRVLSNNNDECMYTILCYSKKNLIQATIF